MGNYGFSLKMIGYYFPRGMRPSTLEERLSFYKDEFELEKVVDWLKDRTDVVRFAVIIGRHTKIYPKKYVEDSSTTIIIDEYKDMEDVKSWIIEFLPEAVYYDRNIYDEEEKMVGQELAFDLDPENITCPIHGSLKDKMDRGQGLSFCELEFQMVKDETIMLYEHLAEQFSNLRVVYSGRGFHIHVLDKDAYNLDRKGREAIANEVNSKGFHIDAWVTTGDMRLIRLPYSLNGLVSRIVIPLDKLELEGFDPANDTRCVPKFLKLR